MSKQEKNKYTVQSKFDCEYTNELVCPYCGEEQSDSWEILSNSDECGDTDCQYCNKNFDYSFSRSVSYSTTCKDGEHDYVVDNKHIEDAMRCERCGNLKFTRYDK